MKYPKVLLPRKRYKYIDVKKLISSNNFLLSRTTDTPDVKDSNGITRKTPEVIGNSSQFSDYSVNLFGPFKRHFIYFSIKKSVRNKYSNSWKLGNRCKKPKNDELIDHNSDEKGILYFDLTKLNNFPLKGQIDQPKLQYNYHIRVEHAPTLSNFWHFELHLYDENNKRIVKKDNGKLPGDKMPRRFINKFKEFLSECSLSDDEIDNEFCTKKPSKSIFTKKGFFFYFYR